MKEFKLTIKDSSLSFLSGFLLCQLGAVVATCFAMIVYKFTNANMENFSSFLNTGVGYLITALGLYLVMLLMFCFFNKGKQNQTTEKVNPKKLLIYIGIAIVSFLTLYPIVTCIDSLLFKWGIELNTLPYALTTKNYYISLISLVIAPAVCEELLLEA